MPLLFALPLLAALGLAVTGQEPELPPVGAPPAIAPADRQGVEAWFEDIDGNRDDVVTAAEFDGFFVRSIEGVDGEAVSPATAAALSTYFDQMDRDGSGTVSLGEFVRFHEADRPAPRLSPG